MPRDHDDDRVRITGVRDFEYRSRNDFTVRYKEREILLSHVVALDFYVSYFMEGPVGHTFVSFIFDNAPPLSISIETRPEVGEGFAPVASMFKQFELIYVVGEERDLVGVRANHRNEPIYLYRLNTSADDARQLLLIYLERINQLADHPEFYHLLTNSCTINIVRYANAAGRTGRLDIRHVLNAGRQLSVPLGTYRHDAAVRRIAPALPDQRCRRRPMPRPISQRIRASLPTILADIAASLRVGTAPSWLAPRFNNPPQATRVADTTGRSLRRPRAAGNDPFADLATIGRIGRLLGLISTQRRDVRVSFSDAGTSAPVISACEATVIQPNAIPWPSSAACITTA